RRDPCRVGLSATCLADESITRFLVGPLRTCRVLVAPPPPGTPPSEFAVGSLIRPGEAPHRGLSYRRLLRRLRRLIDGHRTTVVFANTRAFAEKITHDLRSGQWTVVGGQKENPSSLTTDHCPLTTGVIAAHHSALDAHRRRSIESGLKSGEV